MMFGILKLCSEESSALSPITFTYHFQLSHMAVHHLHHLHYHRVHLLLLVHYFILNSRLGSSAKTFLLRPFPFLPDWFHGLSDQLMILLCSTAGLFAWCVKLSRLLVHFRTHFKSMHFHFIHYSSLCYGYTKYSVPSRSFVVFYLEYSVGICLNILVVSCIQMKIKMPRFKASFEGDQMWLPHL